VVAAKRAPQSETAAAPRRGVPAWVVVPLVLALLGVGGFYLYREGSGRIFAEEAELGAITLMSPQQQDVTLVATGYVYARKKANVAPKAAGRVAKFYVDEGSVVKEGELIVELEAADAQAQQAQVRADIAAARAKVESARASFSLADTQLKRENALFAKEASTQAAHDDAQNRYDAAKVMVTSTEADVKAIESRMAAVAVALDNTRVRAPFAGTVLRKLVEVGEVIPPFTLTGIVTLASLDELEVQADVAEAQFHKVQVGTPAEIILDAYPDRRYRGKVSDVRPMVDRSKASVTVKVRFTDKAPGVLPDMAAKVSFLTKALDEAALKAAPKLIVPADAVVERDGRRVVFTIAEDHAHALPVTVKGPFGDGQLELADGPVTGTRVVRHPNDDVREGVAMKEKKK
jgi:HlyD family secretion protein